MVFAHSFWRRFRWQSLENRIPVIRRTDNAFNSCNIFNNKCWHVSRAVRRRTIADLVLRHNNSKVLGFLARLQKRAIVYEAQS